MFIFGDKTSTEMGLKCVLYTLRNKARFPYTTYHIPGRAEPIIEMSGNAEPVKVEVQCDLMDIANIDAIYAWLHGRGLLIDELHPDKYRIAYSVESINPVMLNDEICTLNITFICSAFMYAVDNEPVIFYDMVKDANVENKGSYYSEPVYEFTLKPAAASAVADNFAFTLFVNGSHFIITAEKEDFNHTIVLDAGRQLAYYKDTGAIILNKTTGTIPFLDTGANNITFGYAPKDQATTPYGTSMVSETKIIKNERWL